MRKIISLLILLLIFSNFALSELVPSNVVIALNCGGESYKDSHGVLYEKVNFKMNFFYFLRIITFKEDKALISAKITI